MQASILSLPAWRSTTAGHTRNLSFGVKAWRQCLQLSWGWNVSSMLWHTPPSPLTLNNFFFLPFQINRWARFQTHLPTLCHSLLCLLCWFLREWIGHSRSDPSLRGNIGQVLWKRLWTGSDLPRRQSESQLLLYDPKVRSQTLFLFQVHFILNEMVMGGMVLETNMAEILSRYEEQAKREKQEVSVFFIFWAVSHRTAICDVFALFSGKSPSPAPNILSFRPVSPLLPLALCPQSKKWTYLRKSRTWNSPTSPPLPSTERAVFYSLPPRLLLRVHSSPSSSLFLSLWRNCKWNSCPSIPMNQTRSLNVMTCSSTL